MASSKPRLKPTNDLLLLLRGHQGSQSLRAPRCKCDLDQMLAGSPLERPPEMRLKCLQRLLMTSLVPRSSRNISVTALLSEAHIFSDAITGQNSLSSRRFTPILTNGLYSRGDLETWDSVRMLIEKCQTAAANGTDVNEATTQLRQSIHCLELYSWVTKVPVAQSQLLDDDHGLSAVFNDQSGIFSWDLQADCRAIHERWTSLQFDSNMFIGVLEFKKNTNGKDYRSRKLDPTDNARVSCNYAGQGKLSNGAWFALQIYALRNGCHGEMEVSYLVMQL